MFDKLLVAIDLMEAPAHQVLSRSTQLGAREIYVIHVVEPQYIQYSIDPTFTGSVTRAMEEDAVVNALNRLAELCTDHDIEADHQLVVVGRTADRVHQLAKAHQVDAIVVGSHVRSTLQRLLGSTANAILHDAPTNVLVVRTNGDQ